MNLEQLVKLELAGETRVLGENRSCYQFSHHKYHITCLLLQEYKDGLKLKPKTFFPILNQPVGT
jgi:hypothetical protein